MNLQGGNIIRDEEGSNAIIDLKSPTLNWINPLVQDVHKIFLIYTSSHPQLEESYELNNSFVEVEKYDEASEVDNYHLINSDLVEINYSIFPHTIYDLNWLLNYNYIRFESPRAH